jgi:hypothetical protein
MARYEDGLVASIRDLGALLGWSNIWHSQTLPWSSAPGWQLDRMSADAWSIRAAQNLVVPDRAWLLLGQVLRFVDHQVAEIRALQVPSHHRNLPQALLDALPHSAPLLPPFEAERSHAPPDVSIDVRHAGDERASQLLLTWLGDWFSAVSVGAFASDHRVPIEGWIALRDEPMARAGVVAMNLTEVRCHEAAFDALEALVIRFHSEVAAVQWMMIE